MSVSTGLLSDAFERIREAARGAVNGLSEEELTYRADATANSVAWLVWHLSRVQDDHIADAAGTEQVWRSGGWAARCALPFPLSATGYGHTPDQVAAVRGVSAKVLAGYHDAVCDRTQQYLAALRDQDFERIVDTSWDPPVTLAVRLVSVIADDLQHAGQAAFVRGLALRALRE